MDEGNTAEPMKGPQAFTLQDVEDAALGRLLRTMQIGELSRADTGDRWKVTRRGPGDEVVSVQYGDTPEEALRLSGVCY